MNIEDIISSGLLELYVAGIATAQEKEQVLQWLTEYPELKDERDAIEASIESYAKSNSIQPSIAVKDKIFSQIFAGEKNTSITNENASLTNNIISTQKNYRIPTFFKLAAAAMFILLIGSIVLNYSYYNKYNDANDKYTAATNELQAANDKLKQNDSENVAMKNELDLMGNKNALPVVLNGTPQQPDALAKIYWMKNTGEIYIDPTNLPSVPEGKQYQFWAIINGKPVDGGMITTAKGIYHFQKMKSFGHADAFAITLEKAGGNPTPQGQMYVVAKVL